MKIKIFNQLFNVYIIFVQTVSQNRWEAERRRQDQLAIEQWRQEAREHDRQMFTIFCSALTNCNAALNILLKAKEEPSSGKKKNCTKKKLIITYGFSNRKINCLFTFQVIPMKRINQLLVVGRGNLPKAWIKARIQAQTI